LVTLADWIASDDIVFPFATSEAQATSLRREHARRALMKLGLDPSEARSQLLSDCPGFGTISPFDPRPIQKACEGLPSYPSGSIVLIEGETGSGKTEAALTRFVQLFHSGAVDGMYFALPTRSAATQLHGRVVSAVKRAFPKKDDRPGVVLGVPGYLLVDDMTGRKLPPFQVLWEDSDKDRFRFRGWAAETPKRYLAGTVIVGTIDQVLLSCIQVKHAHMRATALQRLLLVVDEVHASDVYMGRLLEEVLNHHLSCGGHALLMSATLGHAVQTRLMTTNKHSYLSLEEAESVPYPFIVHADASRTDVQSVETADNGHTKSVRMEKAPIASDSFSIAALALDAAEAGARVLVIRNTVRDCVEVQKSVEVGSSGNGSLLFQARGVVAPHHSRFCKADREALDHAMELEFGKSSRRRGVIAVATQTVQQSLDIDADLLITDLCPADVLLQRIGRLHRHVVRSTDLPADNQARPEGFEEPRCIVLLPSERGLEQLIRSPEGKAYGPHGLGTVYEDLRILEATWQLLESYKIWTIPEMNRRLVESATHPDSLNAIVSDLGGRWQKHHQYILGIHSAQRIHASLGLLQREKPFGEEEFPNDLERARTRLGTGDRQVLFEELVKSAFGNSFRQLVIPAQYAQGVEEEAVVENVSAAETAVHFDYGGKPFIYDRFGLAPFSKTSEEDPVHD